MSAAIGNDGSRAAVCGYTIDAERIEAYHGSESLPFEAGANRRAAVKIVDDRGIESLRIVDLEDAR